MTASLNSAQLALANAMSEAELQESVEETLDTFKWLWFHDEDPRRNNAGLPDLIAVRGGRLLMIELKRASGRVRPAQATWLGELEQTPIEVYVWRPADWHAGTIEDVLR